MKIEDEQWLTGVWEGDGSLTFLGKTPTVRFHQKDGRLLMYIKELLEEQSDVRKHSAGDLELIVSGREAVETLVRIFSEYTVCQSRAVQLTKALKKLPRGGTTGYKVSLHDPTPVWIVGFWDAEGSFGLIGKSLQASISQKDQLAISKIQNLIGGRISPDGYNLGLRRDEMLRFLPTYIKYSHNPQKQERLYRFLQRAVK